MARRGLERDQRPHGVADERGAARAAASISAPSSPPWRRWSRAVHRPSVHGRAGPAPARRSRDARTIAPAAPRPCDRARRRARRQRAAARVEIASAGGGKRLRTVDDELHRSRPLRGAQRLRQIVDDVAAASMPTESRTSSSPNPAALSCAASICWCVVLAGWMTRVLASPTLARWLASRSASMNFRPAARPPLMPQLMIEPAPLGSSRLASSKSA